MDSKMKHSDKTKLRVHKLKDLLKNKHHLLVVMQNNPDPDSTSMIGSCRVLLEIGGQDFELDAFFIFVKRLSTQPDRWAISGIASRTLPVE